MNASLHDRHLLVFFLAMAPLTGAILPTHWRRPVGHRAVRRQALKGGGDKENKTFEIMAPKKTDPKPEEDHQTGKSRVDVFIVVGVEELIVVKRREPPSIFRMSS